MAASLQLIEKKMEMSLDDIIKQNKSKSSGRRKTGSGPATGLKAPDRKLATSSRIKLGASGGVAKAAPVATRPAAPRGAGRRQSLAKKIVARSMAKQQPVPKLIGNAKQINRTVTSAPQGKQHVKIQFNAPKNTYVALKAKESAPKSLAQIMNKKRRQALATSNKQAPKVIDQEPFAQGRRRRRGGRGGSTSGSGPMDIDRPMQGGVRKHGLNKPGRMPIFQGRMQQPIARNNNNNNMRAPVQMGRPGRPVLVPPPHQQRRAPLITQQQQRRVPFVPPHQQRRAPLLPQQQRRGFRQISTMPSMQDRRAPLNVGMPVRQQASQQLQALRMQQLEDARIRAERNSFIHQQMRLIEERVSGNTARAPVTVRAGGYSHRSGY